MNETAQSQIDHMYRLLLNSLSDVPNIYNKFYRDNKKVVTTIALLIGLVVSTKLTFSILNDINQIPLFAPFFELIGIGFSSWVVYRYLLNSESRKELAVKLDNAKIKFFGK